jgi:hypothetical protein
MKDNFRRVRKIAKYHVRPSIFSVCNNWAPAERIFVKFDISVFCENLLRKFKFH